MFRLHEEGRNTETERMIFMWINLGDELVNTDAVSQIIKKKVNDRWFIQFFRLDGSFMTSIEVDSNAEADEQLANIKDLLI